MKIAIIYTTVLVVISLVRGQDGNLTSPYNDDKGGNTAFLNTIQYTQPDNTTNLVDSNIHETNVTNDSISDVIENTGNESTVLGPNTTAKNESTIAKFENSTIKIALNNSQEGEQKTPIPNTIDTKQTDGNDTVFETRIQPQYNNTTDHNNNRTDLAIPNASQGNDNTTENVESGNVFVTPTAAHEVENTTGNTGSDTLFVPLNLTQEYKNTTENHELDSNFVTPASPHFYGNATGNIEGDSISLPPNATHEYENTTENIDSDNPLGIPTAAYESENATGNVKSDTIFISPNVTEEYENATESESDIFVRPTVTQENSTEDGMGETTHVLTNITHIIDNTTNKINENQTISHPQNTENTTEHFNSTPFPTTSETMKQSELESNTNTADEYNNTSTIQPNVENTTTKRRKLLKSKSPFSFSYKVPTPTDKRCTFPVDLVGDWWSTMWGSVSVIEDYLFGVEIGTLGKQIGLECFSNNLFGGFSILREQIKNDSYTGDVFYTCVKFEKRNDDNYHMSIKTERNSLYENQPVVALPSDVSSDVHDLPGVVCNVHSDNALQGHLIRKGKEWQGALGCPEALSGNFDVKYVDQFPSTLCPQGAKMTSCTALKTLSFNYTSCNGTEEYEENDDFLCVAGGNNIVTTFELKTVNESNSLNPFRCMSLHKKIDPDYLLVDGVSSACYDEWNPGQNSPTSNRSSLLFKTGGCVSSPTFALPSPDTLSADHPNDGSGSHFQDSHDSAPCSGPYTLLMTATVILITWISSLGP